MDVVGLLELTGAGIVIGSIGTVAMDTLNSIAARTGLIQKIDVAMIGRMAAGWMRGRFRYGNPIEMKQISNELFYGYLAHFAIGIGLAVPFLIVWDICTSKPVSPIIAVVYGVLTTGASFFFVYPTMGLGIFGMKSTERIKAFISPIANHAFYGIGLAGGVFLMTYLNKQ
jgi:hypothetical protein